MSARNSAQWRGDCLGVFWSVWNINFLTQLVSEPTRGSALLDLLLMKRAGLVGDVVEGHCGHCGQGIIKFSVLGEVRKGVCETCLGVPEGRFWTLVQIQSLITKGSRKAGCTLGRKSSPWQLVIG